MTAIYGYNRQVESQLTEDFRASGLALATPLETYLHELGNTTEGVYEGIALNLDLLEKLHTFLMTESAWAHMENLSEAQKNKMDGWLAPRLHATIRIPRRLAAESTFWTWLAVHYLHGYMAKRWSDSHGTPSKVWRYTGGWLRNGVSRLWWGAELTRNGASYENVPIVFLRTRTAQWALELRYSYYRPATIAFVRIAENEQDRMNDDQMKELSKRANAMLTLQSLEAIAFYDAEQDEPGPGWFSSSPVAGEVICDELPQGPPTASVAPTTIGAMETWFRSLGV